MRGRITPASLALAALLLAGSASPLLGQKQVDGTWAGTISGPQGDQKVTIVLQAVGDSVKGTITDFQGGTQPIEEGVIKADTVSFYQTLSFNGNSLEIFYSALVKAEELLFSIEVDGMQGVMHFTATRTP